MERMSSSLRTLVPGAMVALLLILVLRGESVGDGPKPETDHDPATLMKEKLERSQMVLEGLLRGEMERVKRGAAGLHEIARVPLEGHEEDAVYGHFSVEFQRLTEKLQRVAEQGNVDAATYVHGQITSTCISCHQHVRDVKPIGGDE